MARYGGDGFCQVRPVLAIEKVIGIHVSIRNSDGSSLRNSTNVLARFHLALANFSLVDLGLFRVPYQFSHLLNGGISLAYLTNLIMIEGFNDLVEI